MKFLISEGQFFKGLLHDSRATEFNNKFETNVFKVYYLTIRTIAVHC